MKLKMALFFLSGLAATILVLSIAAAPSRALKPPILPHDLSAFGIQFEPPVQLPHTAQQQAIETAKRYVTLPQDTSLFSITATHGLFKDKMFSNGRHVWLVSFDGINEGPVHLGGSKVSYNSQVEVLIDDLTGQVLGKLVHGHR